MKRTIKRFLSMIGIESKKYIQFCYERDAELYSNHSGLNGETLPVVAAKMRIICHTIEKALSLSDCRDDFGSEKIKELLRLYNIYKDSDGKDNNALEVTESTIYTYAKHRKAHGLDVSFIPQSLLKEIHHNVKCGAEELLYSHSIFKDFITIAKSRHSVRNYSSRAVSQDDIIQAVKLAQTAPSACNRQATRVYAITDASKISALKQRHGGIRTFGQPGVIFVITQDLNLYINEYERNTWLVDGGIFCMNLLYSLNTVGIVNCPIIWGGIDDEDKFISDLACIPENERAVVLVVGGYAPEDGVKTPSSAKRPVSDVLRIIK